MRQFLRRGKATRSGMRALFAITLLMLVSLLFAACSGGTTGSGGGGTAISDPLPPYGLQNQAYSTVLRGRALWAVILCKFSDHTEEPHTIQWYRDFISESGAGHQGMYDYWYDMSYHNLDLYGALVKGWYTMPYTLTQEQTKSRGQRIQDCVDAAASASSNAYTVPSGTRTMVMLNAQVDAGSAGGRVELDPGAQFVAFAGHEMGHGYGMIHSFSNDNYQNASWSRPGEYGDVWDLMSVQHADSYSGVQFGGSGPGINAYYLDKLGWMPRTRIATFGADGAATSTLTLAALNHPEASGPLLVRVPFDPGNLSHYYTVEFRRNDGWDRGIPRDTVLIHEIKLDTLNGGNTTYLVNTTNTPTFGPSISYEWQPGMTFSVNGVTITVNSINSGANTASVTIQGNIADRCLQGYVWREARPTDHVCVTPAERSRVAADNAAAPTRVNPSGPYGPDSCIQGYVWREAYNGDHVCVTPDQRTQAADDNAHASERSNPARLVYGPHTCAQGYVWREADLFDYVCVTGAERAQVASENAAPTAHRAGGGTYGPDTCAQGYVWRDAYPGDHLCVTPARRTQVTGDNAQAQTRVAANAG